MEGQQMAEATQNPVLTVVLEWINNMPPELKKALEPAVCAASAVIRHYFEWVKVQNVQNCGVTHNFSGPANIILGTGVGLSFFGLFVEVVRLCEIWKQICKTKEFLNKEFIEKQKDIQDKLKEVTEKLNIFAKGIEPSAFEKLNSDQKLIFFVDKEEERDEIRELLDDILTAIGDLECNVHGKIFTLNTFSDYVFPAIFGQVLQGGSLGVSMIMLGSFANPITLGFAGFAVGAHIVAISARVAMTQNSKNTVADLKIKLEELKLLRKECYNLKKKLVEDFKKFRKDIKGESSGS